MKFPKAMEVERAERPLRIAVVYSRNPLPMRRADQMTVAHLLAFLHARGHEVDLHCVDAGGEPDDAEVKWLAGTCHVFRYANSPLAIARGLSRVVTSLLPVQVGLFSNPAQTRGVRSAARASSYDVIYTYYIRSAEITRSIGRVTNGEHAVGQNLPVTFLAYQLSQSLNARRIAKNAPNFLLKAFYEIESRLLARYEAKIWQKFTRCVFIGRKDIEEVQGVCRRYGQPTIDNYVFGAHGTDAARFAPRQDIRVKPDHLVFSGVMRTPTNINAVMWFAKNVWPMVKAKRPAATWSIVGREPSADVLQLGKLAGVMVTGAVPDTSVQIAEAAVCINPMQAGGGMQNKLIEYMASAKAVVATSVANEGIEAPDEAILIADQAEDFSAAVLKCLENPALAEKIGANARSYVLREWTWEAHFLKLEENFYSALLRTR